MSRKFVIAVPVGPGSYHLLDQTLRSIAMQESPVSIALCHAGAAEDIEDIVAPFRNFISYERHAPDAGQSAAINEGWRNCDGDILGWLNADDTLAPGALKRVSELFDEHPDATVACGQSNIIDEAGNIVGLHPVVKKPDADLYRSNVISQPSCFVARTAIERAGFVREDLHYVMDWDLWVRLMQAGETFAFTPDVLSSVVWGQDTKTASFGWKRVKELRDVVSRLGQPVTTAKTLFGFGMHHLSEYSAVSGLLKPINARLRHGQSDQVHFWGTPRDDGSVMLDLFSFAAGEAMQPVLNFADSAHRQIRIGDTEAFEAEGLEVPLPVALAAGDRQQVCVSSSQAGGANPTHVAFVAYSSAQTGPDACLRSVSTG